MAAKDKATKSGIKTFEASTRQLESIIETLESEDISLDEALKAFEEGIRICRSAQKALEEAEQQVTLLLEENGEVVATEFSGSQDQE